MLISLKKLLGPSGSAHMDSFMGYYYYYYEIDET